jgi:hypothetical protein
MAILCQFPLEQDLAICQVSITCVYNLDDQLS